jgi:hypothetical protein
MADIFGYNRGGAADVFVADRSRLTIVGVDGVDLIQNWSVQYQQNIQPLYEVGSSRLFWAKSNPIGSGSIGRIVGQSFLTMSHDICDGGTTITITNASGSCSGGQVGLSCVGAICTSIGFSAQAGNPTVSESLAFQFASLKVG